MLNLFNSHRYSLCATGIKFKCSIYASRDDATKAMYDYCGRKGYTITEVWDDNHDKTYLCGNSIKFYISRVS